MLFVGLGLGGVEDLSARALQALKECDQVFGEFYTSKLIDSTPDDLEKVIGKSIVRLKRREVEEEETVIEAAKKGVASKQPQPPRKYNLYLVPAN
mgnify:CR=1 FL=1